MQDLGVCSLKIEGRARRSYYVAEACRIYRKSLDGEMVTEQDLDKLKMAFNRGYTPAYFNGNANIISQIQGNNGLEIGKVEYVKYGKKFNEIFISSNYDLTGKCGLKFIYKGKEIASIGAYDIKKIGKLFRLTTTSDIKTDSKVYIIQDENIEQKTLNYIRKLPIKIKFEAIANHPMIIEAQYKNINVKVVGEICQEAKTIGVTADKILNQMSRSEVFEICDFDCKIDNCYILNSTINKLRNNIYEQLKQKIINKNKKEKINKINILKLNNTINNQNIVEKEFNFNILNKINNLKQNNNLIFDYDNFNEKEIIKFNDYCKNNNLNGFIDIPNFATEQDIKIIKNVLSKTNLGVVANNLYAFDFECKMIGGQFLNVYNSYTLDVLQGLHKLEAVFVEELNINDIDKLQTDLPILKREKVYMTLLHCPFKQHTNCNCNDCKYSDDSRFKINSGKQFNIKRKKTATCVFLLKD